MGKMADAMRLAVGLVLVVGMVSCGGGGGGVSKRIGTSGGVINGPGNVVVVFPPGALFGDVTINVSQVPSATPPLGAAGLATPVRLTPKAQDFAQPVDITLPVASSTAPLGSALTGITLLRGNFDTGIWVAVPANSAGPGLVTVHTDVLGDFVAVDSTTVDLGACGDTMCLTGETCSSCPLDCGLCLTGGIPVGGGGGDTDAGSMKNDGSVADDAAVGPSSPLQMMADGTLHDPRTNLIWERATSVAPTTGAAALTACASVTFAGLTWRLPTVEELQTVRDVAGAGTIWFSPMVGPSTGVTWTATPAINDPTGTLYAITAPSGETRQQANTGTGEVRCVSGTSTLMAPVLMADGLGVVTDLTSGLQWEQNATAPAGSYASAVAYCSTLQIAGSGGFRVPTLDELTRLVRFDVANPALDSTAFPTMTSLSLWTSTPLQYAPTWQHYVWFTYGETLTIDAATTSLGVRCVR